MTYRPSRRDLRLLPREALFEAARDATLTVVGARGAGVVEWLTLGATSDALLMHVPGTVTVVPNRPA